MLKNTTKQSSKSYHFYNMGAKPLAYPVMCGKGVAIPAGTTRVKIAFGQSHLKRWNENTQKWVPMNVYCFRGHLYHQ